MRIGLLDCFAGVAGDMWVGAMLDAGAPFADLEAAVRSLDLPGVTVKAERVRRAGIAATRFLVEVATPAAHERHLHEVLDVLARADVPPEVAAQARQVFEAIAAAEARAHGRPIDHVHFHEVGAEDTIVDVLCACLSTARLGIGRLYASAVVVGSGTVACEHGTMPVPAPGTLGLLAGIPIRSGELPGEATTPTGAALLRTLVHAFEPDLPWVPEHYGHGAGSRDTAGRPNVLRIAVGETRDPGARTSIVELQCQLDTITGEEAAWLTDELLARGAVDVWTSAVQMKKGRPGLLLTVLAEEAQRDALARLLLEESTTLGLRVQRVAREVVERWQETLESPLGPVRCKCARLPSGLVVRRAEEEELRRLARETGRSRREIVQLLEPRLRATR